jgi:hypothetical protein
MSNYQKIINKLILALKQNNIIILINSYQVYSSEHDKIITIYSVKNGKNEIIKTSNKVNIIKALADILKEAKNDPGK